MKTGIELIAQERKEHFKKGRTVELDVFHNPNKELATASCALIRPDLDAEQQGNIRLEAMPETWRRGQLTVNMINNHYKERLIIAGALIAAEIDRLLYIESNQSDAAQNREG